MDEGTDIVSACVNLLQRGACRNVRDIYQVCRQTQRQLSSAHARILAGYVVEELSRQIFPAITHLELFLTQQCVLQCDYCFTHAGNSAKNNVTSPRANARSSWRIAQSAVDFLITYSRQEKHISLLFFGGEPLMEFPLLQRTVLYAKKAAAKKHKHISFDITTNGILLDEEKLAFFKKYQVKFLLSIDGTQQAHDAHRVFADGSGSWKRIVEALPVYKKYQPWLGTRMTVSPDTAADVYAGVRELASRGIQQFLISPVEGVSWSRRALRVLFAQLARCKGVHCPESRAPIRISFWEDIIASDYAAKKALWGCRAGRQSVCVDTDGAIYPCSKMMFPVNLKQECRLGSVSKGIENIGLRCTLTDVHHHNRPQCAQCEYKPMCTGGCYAQNYWAHADMFKSSKQDHCRFIEETHAVKSAVVRQA